MSFRTPSPLGLRLRAQSRPIIFATALSFGAVLLSFPVRAGEHSHTMAGDAMPPGMMMMSPPPVGVPGASMPAPGKTVAMFTNRWLHLDGTKAGTKDVSPEWVVLNGFNPNRPPVQYRRVPTSATIHVQGFGLTHGLTPWLSVNVAGAYITKATRVTTFRGPAGTSVLGQRTDSTEGFGDTALGAAVRLWQGHGHRLHAGLSLSLPTGSITARIRPLMPTGAIGNARAGYSLQIGTGTYDLLPALTFTGKQGRLGYGAAYRGRIALQDENSEGYRWGDMHMATAWLSYDVTRTLTGSLRIEATTRDAIDGRDVTIAGPGVGANPLNTGGDRIDAYVGANLRGQVPGLGMARIGTEFGVPLYERANGIHLVRQWSFQLTGGLSF
ncbi:MAG: hypothetical protein KDJ41_03980 [Hyphomicrobiaceae bacterium]|nr:hypothetical protein [Hyphomicrobiaceae bacterium]